VQNGLSRIRTRGHQPCLAAGAVELLGSCDSHNMMAKLSPKRKCWVQMVSIQQEAAKKALNKEVAKIAKKSGFAVVSQQVV